MSLVADSNAMCGLLDLFVSVYCQVKLGNIVHKTEVFKKSLNPQWNSDWFRFEVIIALNCTLYI